MFRPLVKRRSIAAAISRTQPRRCLQSTPSFWPLPSSQPASQPMYACVTNRRDSICSRTRRRLPMFAYSARIVSAIVIACQIHNHGLSS